MSVFELERSVTLAYNCELLPFHKMSVSVRIEEHPKPWSNSEIGEIWHSCFIWRGQPLLRRVPVTSRENPFDVKEHSKPADRVFSYEQPGFELHQKGEITTTDVKKKEKSQLGSRS